MQRFDCRKTIETAANPLHAQRRHVHALFLGAIAAIAAMSLTAAQGLADVNAHLFSSAFGSAGSGAGQLSLSSVSQNGSGIAVNHLSHDVYVADTFNKRVDEFDTSGSFIRAWGWGVADGATSFEICTTTCQAGLEGHEAGQFARPNFIAVDNSGGASAGDVYVSEAFGAQVQKFDSSGALIASWGSGGQLNGSSAGEGPFESIAGIAVDSSGRLLVDDASKSVLFEFAQDGTPEPTIGLPGEAVRNGIAVDTQGNLYKILEARPAMLSVEQFSPGGSEIGDVTSDLSFAEEVIGFALNAASNDLYADIGGYGEGGAQIRHYADPSTSACVAQSTCTAADTFGKGIVHQASGVAVDSSNDLVYVADSGDERIAVFAPPAPAAPAIDAVSASNVTSTSADLHAQINPNQRQTTYHFEYGASTSYGTSVPAPDADLGSGFGDRSATVHLTGLQPNTEYHYRVLASNALGVTVGQDHTFSYPTGQGLSSVCPNEAFRTGPSASLPDCRAYELVSPEFVAGQPVFAHATDGQAITFQTLGAPGAAGDDPTSEGASYLARRTQSGWESTPLDPPASQFQADQRIEPTLEAVSADLQSTLFIESANAPFDRGFNVGWYLRGRDGAFAQVGPAVSPATAAELTSVSPAGLAGTVNDIHNQGESEDLSTVLFSTEQAAGFSTSIETPNPLTNWHWPGDTTDLHEPSLYEYAGTGNSEPALVGVRNEGPLHGSPHLNDGAELIGECGTGLGSGPEAGLEVNKTGSWSSLDVQNAVSRPGSVVFFTPLGPEQREGTCAGSTPPADELFARIDGSRTVAISEPTSADCASCDTAAPQNAIFQGANRDGSKAFFLTGQELLPGNPGENLYEYDFNAPAGTKVTAVSHLAAGAPAEVLGEVGLAEDGSHVYFVAGGVLTTEANGVGGTARAGDPNLYAYDTGTQQVGFVATLSQADANDWSANFSKRAVDLTADGRFLLFASSNDLTPDASGADRQLYRYDAQTGALVRVSIGEGGFNDNGNNTGADVTFAHGGSPASETEPQNHSMSEDGAYVFFESEAALTTRALDHACAREESGHCRAPVKNIYEYHDGHIYLISDGQDRHAALESTAVSLIGTDASGANVLITSADQLASPNVAVQRSIYDVRIGGGFPAPSSRGSCQESTCQGPTPSPPAPLTPASAGFAGSGNLAPAPGVRPALHRKKPLTRAQKLARALRACKQKPKRKRAACKRLAQRAYGAKHKQTKSRKGGK
jgi:NHL repeat